MNIVIICGGSGTRLWPLSTKEIPKQFLKLTHPDYTMFQLTCQRAKKLNPKLYIIVCNKKHADLVIEQLSDLDISNYKILAEPFGRNTAPAIALACHITDKKENILVMSSDHVWDDDQFSKSVHKGLSLIDEGIVFFGIKPGYPETGYGYIQHKGNELIRFIEKPNLQTAASYLEDGNYVWNSGNFLFKNSIMISEFITNAPKIWTDVQVALKENNFIDEKLFSYVQDISIDYAIMEKHKHGRIVIYSSYWYDIGSYKSLYQSSPKDEKDNVIICNKSRLIDSSDNYFHSKKSISAIGVHNLVVIVTDDDVLIMNKDRCQDVKLLQ